jgi:hypothetical protein
MPEFSPGQTIETDTPTIDVTATPQKPFPPGKLTFSLVVVDDSGNESLPSMVTVVVLDNARPTAVVTAPPQVPVGQAFNLDGRQSTDVGGGRIVRYRWTLVSQQPL